MHTQDPNELTALVRIALGRAIVQQLFPGANELSVMTLDNRLERLLMQAMGAGGDGTGIEPGLADTIAQQAGAAAAQQEQMGLTPVLLVPGPLRALLSRFLRRALPQLKVLSHSEIPETKTIRVTSLVGAPGMIRQRQTLDSRTDHDSGRMNAACTRLVARCFWHRQSLQSGCSCERIRCRFPVDECQKIYRTPPRVALRKWRCTVRTR